MHAFREKHPKTKSKYFENFKLKSCLPDEELEIPDFDHDLSDSEGESKKENNEMHKIESPTKKGTICLQL